MAFASALRRVAGSALVALCGLLCPAAMAQSFTVSDIRLQGLQRVSAGTVFNILPVQVGETVDEVAIRQIIRLLFESGYFDDIRMARDNDVLVISLVERPAIESIEIDGNKAIKTEALIEGLNQQGLSEGEIFKQATLERVGLELERQYVSQGRYGASIDTNIEDLPRNRVAISIDIEEGKTSGIRHINVVGATMFSEQDLLDEMELQHPGLFSFFRNNDKYNREKLSGDLEKLESYYKDRGYVEFEITSTQVSVTPDKRQVYISMNVHEGDKYIIDEVNLLGELNDVKPEELRPLLLVQPGQVFSQAWLTATEERLEAALGNAGYTFASAGGIPRVKEGGEVSVDVVVDAGKRAYVRRIAFAGNRVTQDEVMRRELRQMEGGWASTAQIDLSKLRLERLGYFQEVNVETPEVPGTDDQIDVNFTVKEQPSGSISATLGYSQGWGLVVGGNYQENNVLGTGNSLGLGLSYSKYQKSANFNYFNPYYTLDGISRGYNAYFRRLDWDERNIARYSTDAFGVGLNFGFPIGETQRINFGGSVERTSLTEGRFPALEITEFLEKNGDDFLNFKANLSWVGSTLNRGLFPTRGRSQTLALQASVPGSDLEFWKVTYRGEQYFPFFAGLTLRFRTEMGYGGGYGGTKALPFYEHFFSGGFGSIRGFEQSTLGPRTTNPQTDIDGNPIPEGFFRRGRARNGDPFGGNLLVEGSLELILTLPFVEENRQFRPVIFVDAGNVFNTNCPDVSQNCFGFDFDEFRYSVGFGITWLTAMGPMTFGIAKPFNTSEIDEKESFQFELGVAR